MMDQSALACNNAGAKLASDDHIADAGGADGIDGTAANLTSSGPCVSQLDAKIIQSIFGSRPVLVRP